MSIELIIAIINAGACALFFIYCRAYLKKRTGQERILAEFKEEVSKLVAEIDMATDRDVKLVEDRIKTLKGLLDTVDKRIVMYDEELSKRRAHEEAYAELGRRRVLEPPLLESGLEGGSAQSLLNRPAREPYADPSPPRAPQEEPTETAADSGNDAVPAAEQSPEDESPAQRRVRIAEMAKAGFAPRLIATRLGMSISEVELAIAIAERRLS